MLDRPVWPEFRIPHENLESGPDQGQRGGYLWVPGGTLSPGHALRRAHVPSRYSTVLVYPANGRIHPGARLTGAERGKRLAISTLVRSTPVERSAYGKKSEDLHTSSEVGLLRTRFSAVYSIYLGILSGLFFKLVAFPYYRGPQGGDSTPSLFLLAG